MRFLPILSLALLLGQGNLFALEPWADPRMPLREGVVIWLDASRENPAREKLGLPAAPLGGFLDTWHDLSGAKRHLRQASLPSRPKFKGSNNNFYVDFDGKDDGLIAFGLNEVLTNATAVCFGAPRSNAGFFRSFLSLSQNGRNDYTSGLNLDLGPSSSAGFQILNAEGAGFGGVANLISRSLPFGGFHSIAATVDQNAVTGWLDGRKDQSRPRSPSQLALNVFTVGARHYSNTGEAPYIQGFLDGTIAEVLLFDRALNADEIARLNAYFQEKYAALIRGGAQEGFVPVAEPPPVQMLVPGFTARELPLDLSNINNLRYRADGKLVAVTYDGRILLLSDSNGDGLEDKVSVFWDKAPLRAPIGMALTPPNYPRGQGVFIPSKGKISLIVDTNNDDVADQEIVVAEGWKELPHGVDALGVAVDREGTVYFGLGTANFTDAYLIDRATGRARYDLKNERGTILRVTPDFKSREIYCTGIRFPVGLTFNAAGDLFCTDQEGATWLPNGNPLDELLYIERGRHYGFPPRHPKHLPDVIDEPSVFDYAPQHQSICGLIFNDPVNGGPVFGPDSWRGDAIVCGYSRGKLYRTKLLKTASGYLAQSQLLAQLNMLTVDSCVSPQGDLVVAVHSGLPDWGSGPSGKGKLYKIAYTGRDLPQPVLAVSPSPTEIKIGFDRPLQPEQVRDWSTRAVLLQGKYISAGERFESLRPGYQVVQDQLAAPRDQRPILSARLSPDRRNVTLVTSPRHAAVRYAVTLPGFGKSKSGKGILPQDPAIDVLSDLSGLIASYTGAGGSTSDEIWLPHFDLAVARKFSKQGPAQQEFLNKLAPGGLLRLRALLNLWKMLQPAIQPGAQLDYTPPREQVTLDFRAASPFSINFGDGAQEARRSGLEFVLSYATASDPEKWLPVDCALHLDTVPPGLTLSWHTTADPRPRAFSLQRIFVPWAQPQEDTAAPTADRIIPEIAGGNWVHGQRVFFSEKAACFKCHQVRGLGGKAGPDLSNLVQRDYASVVRDITLPNAALNPDHIAYQVDLKNGESLTGVPRESGKDHILLALASGQIQKIPRADIAAQKASTLSLMPEGFGQVLSKAELKDLLTFLLTAPLETAPLEAPGEPPARNGAEIQPFISPSETSTAKPWRIVLVDGPKDHGPGEHDYPLWKTRWTKLLSLADQTTVEQASNWPTPAQLEKADVIIFYNNNNGWSAERGPELDRLLERGGGAVFLHYAVDGRNAVEQFSQRIGLAWRGGASKFRHGPLDLSWTEHEITHGLPGLHLVDESYWNLVGNPKDIHLLATGPEEGAPQPLLWTREQGKGRVFVSIPGHYTWSFDDPLFRLVLFRGICWSAHQPLDRLNELLTLGARIH